MRVYIAGSLFNEADREQRIAEEEMLYREARSNGIEVGIFNPITQPFNEDKSKLPTAEDIYAGDYQAIKDSTHLLVNLDNPDDLGVILELGQAIEMDTSKIYCVMSDMRLSTAGSYTKERVPFGYNQYVMGAILSNEHVSLHYSSGEAIEAMMKDFIEEKEFMKQVEKYLLEAM